MAEVLCWACEDDAPGMTLAALRSRRASGRDLVKSCLNIDVDDTTSPKVWICDKCCAKLKAFYNFKLIAIESFTRLLNSCDRLKPETAEEDGFKTETNVKLETIAKSEHHEVNTDNGEVRSVKNESLELVEVKVELDLLGKHSPDTSDDDLPIATVLEAVPTKKKRGRPPRPKTEEEMKPKIKKKLGRPRFDDIREPKTGGKMCDICGATVTCIKTHLRKHLPASERRIIPCKFCDKTFSTYTTRRNHVQTKHLPKPRIPCPKCNKLVKNMASHDLLVHNRDRLPCVCSMCEKRFPAPSMLAEHMSVHTHTNPYECPDCGTAFRLKATMLDHKRRIHDKERSFLCDFCSKGFFKKFALVIHLRSHTGERPVQCPECGEHFRSNATLRVHLMRSHHQGPRRFPCPHCDKAFYTVGSLKNHILSHTKEKPYKCSYCDAAFGRSEHRNRHQRNIHQQTQTPDVVRRRRTKPMLLQPQFPSFLLPFGGDNSSTSIDK